MGKTLVIVESPAKSKTIQKYLGQGYTVKASMGHVRDLPQKELGVDIDNGFRPKYVISDTRGVVGQLKNHAKSSDQVLLASDPDREGEAIAWHLHALLKKECRNIKRVQFNEITQASVKKAVSNPSDVDLNLVNSQQARRILDRIVGYQLSPWLNQTLGGRLSAGRVQSVALRIIADREREIKNFKPEEYWKIYANLTSQHENIPFQAELEKKGKEKVEITNKAEADAIVQEIDGKPYVVKQIIKKQRDRRASAPFTTSTLQQEGVRKLKWDSKKTMKVAQALYEGVELENKTPHGLITYMRTDSTRINEDFQRGTLDFIRGKWGDRYAPNKPNMYKTKGDAQDAHEAIRPTSVEREPDAIRQYLSSEQYQLYKLIWERYVASQMASAIYDTQTVMIQVGEYFFKASGYSVTFDGFMALYLEDKDVEDGKSTKDEKEKQLPILSENQTLDLIKLAPTQKFTTPPPKFTRATIISELEKLGVGRPSTYSTIISTLEDRQYVEVVRQKFEVTDLGFSVVDTLVKYFPDVMDVRFTSSMEEQLDDIADGKANWVQTLNTFYGPFASALSKAKSETPVTSNASTETRNEPCPDCGKPMVVRGGRNGKFYACTGYPDCKKTAPYVESNAPSCDKCGKPMTVINGKNGKFYACTGYPDCRNTKPIGGSSGSSKSSTNNRSGTTRSNATGGSGNTLRGKCSCGGAITEDNRVYRCSACGKTVWKNGLENRGKKTINKTEASQLLSGKKLEMDFISRSNKKYTSIVYLSDDGKLKVDLK